MSTEGLALNDISKICFDYINNGLTKKEICLKHHISSKLFNIIHEQHNLDQQKIEYTNLSFQRNLKKMATINAKALLGGHDFMTKRIEELSRLRDSLEKEGKMMSTAHVKEVQSLTMSLLDFAKYRSVEERQNKNKNVDKVEVVFIPPKKK